MVKASICRFVTVCGEELVYLGWRWSGTNNDEWSIDDIEVRALAPDLDVELTTSEASPGDTVTLSLIVDNMTEGAAEGCDTVLELLRRRRSSQCV